MIVVLLLHVTILSYFESLKEPCGWGRWELSSLELAPSADKAFYDWEPSSVSGRSPCLPRGQGSLLFFGQALYVVIHDCAERFKRTHVSSRPSEQARTMGIETYTYQFSRVIESKSERNYLYCLWGLTIYCGLRIGLARISLTGLLPCMPPLPYSPSSPTATPFHNLYILQYYLHLRFVLSWPSRPICILLRTTASLLQLCKSWKLLRRVLYPRSPSPLLLGNHHSHLLKSSLCHHERQCT